MEYILRHFIEFSILNSARMVLLAYDLTPVSSARSKKNLPEIATKQYLIYLRMQFNEWNKRNLSQPIQA